MNLRALRIVLTCLTVSWLGATGCLDPLTGGACAEGYDRCGQVCIDLSSSADNCGACGVSCAGSCSRGVCLPPAGDAGEDPDAMSDDADGGRASGDDANRDGGGGARAGDGGGGAGGADAGSGGMGGGGAGGGGAGGGSTGGGGGTAGGAGGGAPGEDAGAGSGGGSAGLGDDAGAGASGEVGDGGAADAVDAPGADDAADPDAGASSDAPDVDAADLDAAVADAADPIEAGPDALTGCGDSGLIFCGGSCQSLDLDNDPDNCGGCGSRCVSGLCTAGVCQGRSAGHLVVIGHDYTVPREGMNNLLGNSVFLSLANPVRVVALEGDATASSIAGANAAIAQVASQLGRSWLRIPVAAETLTTTMPIADVVLIYAQTGSDDTRLQQIAALPGLATALRDFVDAGKTIVLLDSTAGPGSGTYQILPPSMFLVNGGGIQNVTGQTLNLSARGDLISARVPVSYRAETSSASFDTPFQTVVVETSANEPVVIHLPF